MHRGISCFQAVLLPSYAPVQDLLKKIEADAEARLPLPPNADAAEKLARYKGFLKVETHRLKLLAPAGAGGREICQGRAAMLDALLRHLVGNGQGSLSRAGAKGISAAGARGHRRLRPRGVESAQRH